MPVRKDAQIITPIPKLLKHAWEDECIRIKRGQLRFQGRRIYQGNVLNGLVALFLERPVAERDKIAEEALRSLLKWGASAEGSDDGTSVKNIIALPPHLRGVGAAKPSARKPPT
jgi:hypothetical protein